MHSWKASHTTTAPGLSDPPGVPEVDPLAGLDPALLVERLVRRRTGGAVDRLRIEIADGEIQLTGRCRTFYAKQLAQQAVLEARPGQVVRNLIEVA